MPKNYRTAALPSASEIFPGAGAGAGKKVTKKFGAFWAECP
jgi:hypothetical protein